MNAKKVLISRVYVPVARASEEAIVDRKRGLAVAAGGLTVYPARGYWFDGRLLQEAVEVWEVISDQPHIGPMLDALRQALHEMGEEEVLITQHPAQLTERKPLSFPNIGGSP